MIKLKKYLESPKMERWLGKEVKLEWSNNKKPYEHIIYS